MPLTVNVFKKSHYQEINESFLCFFFLFSLSFCSAFTLFCFIFVFLMFCVFVLICSLFVNSKLHSMEPYR